MVLKRVFGQREVEDKHICLKTPIKQSLRQRTVASIELAAIRSPGRVAAICTTWNFLTKQMDIHIILFLIWY